MKKLFALLALVAAPAFGDQIYETNRFGRCTVHAERYERLACVARIMGEGIVSGSVKGGGILYTLEYFVIDETQLLMPLDQRTSSAVVFVETKKKGSNGL